MQRRHPEESRGFLNGADLTQELHQRRGIARRLAQFIHGDPARRQTFRGFAEKDLEEVVHPNRIH
ncbi:MAG: hypothetical protein AB7E71_03285 [Dongiaceae bacterium]